MLRVRICAGGRWVTTFSTAPPLFAPELLTPAPGIVRHLSGYTLTQQSP